MLMLAGLVGVTTGVGGYAFLYAKGYSYLLNDPAACANCHVMRTQYARLDEIQPPFRCHLQ